jgi:hypothetical protein
MFLFQHVFVGNLPLGACCYICEEDCGSEYGLVDWLCCWCQRTVHSQCRIHIEEVFLFLSVHVFSYFLDLKLRLLNEKGYKVDEKTIQMSEKENNGWRRRCCGEFCNLFCACQMKENVEHGRDDKCI